MTQLFYLLAALAIGMGSAVQISLLGQLGRLKGATEASWINVLVTFLGLAVMFGAGALKDNPPNLPSPFNHLLFFLAIGAAAGIALAISLQGVSLYLGIAGVFGFLYVIGASALAPKIGIALFACTVTAGTLTGSVFLDHIGAFGADVQRITAFKAAGLTALLIGVVMVRSGR